MNAPSERVSLREWVRSPRFEVRDVLGTGASGVVLCAFDLERAEEVALKVVRESSERSVRVLRAEFEMIRSISHPSFVAAGELFDKETHPFFSMEKVEGTDLVHYVCTQDGYDEGKLRPVFAQLTRALRVLHRQGRVHRDVKPSNVRVTPAGRLVLLDLGLCAELHALEARPDVGPVGTAHYMAPEQAAGDVSAASDLYAVGVLLFRCLTGACPFEGPVEQVLLLKQSADPPVPEAEQTVAPDLKRLCMQLLARDPHLRPTAGQILTIMEPAGERDRAASSASLLLGAVPLVGRDDELSRVVAACTGASREPVRVWVHGASGSGKTAFLRAAAQRLGAIDPEHTWVLYDRCEPRPWLPYQGLAHAIGKVATRLREAPQDWVEALAIRDVHCLGDLFPAFKRVSAFALLEDGARVPDPVERRWRAFLALRSLLSQLAQQRRLVFVIDDLHWADGDTLQLLAALTDVERPGVSCPSATWLMSSGTVDPGSLASASLSIALPLLTADHVALLADELLDPRSVETVLSTASLTGARAEPRLVVEVLRQAIFFGVEATPATATLDELYTRRVISLDEHATRALDACAIAGRPLSSSELAVVADIESTQVGRHLGILRALGLIADSTLSEDRAVEVPSLTLRAVVVARLSKERIRELSLRLVAASQGADQRPNATLLRYQLGAHHFEAARRTAALGARAAEDVMAFEHAVHVYELASAAWEGQPDDLQREVLRSMGEALACAGYTARAAESFSRASEGAKSADSLEMRRRAAEYWLRSGHIEEGIAALVRLLSEVSVTLPKRGQRALVSLLWQRAALSMRGLDFTRKTPHQLSARDLTTVDVLASVGSLIGLVDFVSGADFQTRAVREALQTGEPNRVAKAFCVEATFTQATEASPRPRAKRLVEIADMIAEEMGDAYLRGMVLIARASIQLGESKFEESARSAIEAERLFRECCTGVTWEIGQVQHMALMALMQRGALGDLTTRAQRYQREALERGDLYGWTHIVTAGGFLVPLIANKPQEALDLVAQAMARWPRDSFHLQHFFEMMALVQVDLYQGGTAGLERLEASWPALKRSMLLRVPIIFASASWMLALAILAARVAAPAKYPDALKRVRTISAQIAKVDAPHCYAWVRFLDAQLAYADGQRERARVLAEEARIEIARFGLGLFSERVQYLCGALTAGDAGARLRADALNALRTQGVVDPYRYVRQAVPVLEAP